MEVAQLLTERGGYASRPTLLRHVSRHALYRALDCGQVVRLQRGVYGLGLPEGTDRLTAAAVALGAVVSHDSAAVLWGLEMVHRPSLRVTVPRNRSRASFPGVLVRRADVEATEVRQGLLVTSVLQTVVDCGRALALRDAVVIADSALRNQQISHDELLREAARCTGRGASSVRRMAHLADPRCGSVLESLLRVLLAAAGLAPEATQYPVRDERGLVAVVDFAWVRRRLIVEADGFEFHSRRSDYRRDRHKANAYCRLDWRLLRFSYEDIQFDPDYVVDAVRHELAKPVVRVRRRSRSTQRAA